MRRESGGPGRACRPLELKLAQVRSRRMQRLCRRSRRRKAWGWPGPPTVSGRRSTLARDTVLNVRSRAPSQHPVVSRCSCLGRPVPPSVREPYIHDMSTVPQPTSASTHSPRWSRHTCGWVALVRLVHLSLVPLAACGTWESPLPPIMRLARLGVPRQGRRPAMLASALCRGGGLLQEPSGN